tara:strand:- start:4278 stop:4823 length:546 start_codon:yes stop_codon:yes gene_type:complete
MSNQYKSWYTANGDEETSQENVAEGTSTPPTPVEPAVAQSIVEKEFTPVQETLRDTDGNFNIFRLAPENDPNSAEFDPTLPESQVGGAPRRSSEEWDEYNKQRASSSGDMMARGVVFGGVGGVGGGENGKTTVINQTNPLSKGECPVCNQSSSKTSYKAIIPSFLVGALAFFLVNKFILKK